MKIAAIILALCFAASAQVAEEANKRYQTPQGREALASGLAGPHREVQEKPRELVAAMGLKHGMTVADVGTGPGFMLPYLGEAVGPKGRVLAEDIFDNFLARARANANSHKLENVSFIKGTETDPALPAGEVDCVLVLDAYHHFNYPDKMLAGIRSALRPSGKLVIVEYYRTRDAMAGGNALQHIRLDEPGVIREVESHGFRLVSRRVHIKDSQYMLILESK